MAPDRQHFVHGAVADHFAHHAFGKIAQRFLRLACAEQIHFRISNPILDHPWHKRGVQITRDHRLSFLRLRIALVHVHRGGRGKTELELLQTLGRHDVDFIEVRNRIGQPGINDVVISAEPSLHTDGVCRNRREPEQQCEKYGYDADAGDHTENQPQRFNGKMFDNVRSRHRRLLLTQSSHGSASQFKE